MADMEQPVCSVCGTDNMNITHDARPIDTEPCCPDCNMMVVVPTRLRVLTSGVLYEMDNFHPDEQE
jgi:hypothetical protein